MAGADATHSTRAPHGDSASAAAGHATGHAPDDEDPYAEPLGEPDLRAWGAALMGAAIAGLVAISLFIATQA